MHARARRALKARACIWRDRPLLESHRTVEFAARVGRRNLFRIYCFIAMACCHCLRNASRLDWSKKNEASTSGPTGIGLALWPSVFTNAAAELAPSTSVRRENRFARLARTACPRLDNR